MVYPYGVYGGGTKKIPLPMQQLSWQRSQKNFSDTSGGKHQRAGRTPEFKSPLKSIKIRLSCPIHFQIGILKLCLGSMFDSFH